LYILINNVSVTLKTIYCYHSWLFNSPTFQSKSFSIVQCCNASHNSIICGTPN